MRPTPRRCGLAALLLTGLLIGPASAGPDRLETRARLADALYLESGLGDLRGALAVYQQIATAEDVAADLAAEALHRQGLAHLALGEPAAAETAWLQLMERHPGSGRAADAAVQLDRMEGEARRVELPARLDFDRDLSGLLHARSLSDRGQLAQELTDEHGTLDGVAAWRTWVTAGRVDLVALGFVDGVAVQGQLGFDARTDSFPAHLRVVLVHADGRAFASALAVVAPDQGRVRIELTASDLEHEGAAWTPGESATRLEIHDVTGRRSTDRGENLIQLDDLAVR